MNYTTATPPSGDSEWEVKRAQILTCAADVFLERGFERGTTKEVAERAGLSQSSIYHYVGAKTDLLSGLAHFVEEKFSAGLDGAMDSSDDAATQLRNTIHNFVDLQVNNLGAWTVYWEEQHSIPADTARAVVESKGRYVRRIDDLVRRCQDAGQLPKGPPSRILAEGILGALAGIYRWYRPDGPHTPDSIATSLSILFGLPDPASPAHAG